MPNDGLDSAIHIDPTGPLGPGVIVSTSAFSPCGSLSSVVGVSRHGCGMLDNVGTRGRRIVLAANSCGIGCEQNTIDAVDPYLRRVLSASIQVTAPWRLLPIMATLTICPASNPEEGLSVASRPISMWKRSASNSATLS